MTNQVLVTNTIRACIDELIRYLCTDYYKFAVRAKFNHPDVEATRFAKSIRVEFKKKYAKILSKDGDSCWGFIVLDETNSKFKRGDILKPANYNAPAKNFARGNVFAGSEYFKMLSWAGPGGTRKDLTELY